MTWQEVHSDPGAVRWGAGCFATILSLCAKPKPTRGRNLRKDPTPRASNCTGPDQSVPAGGIQPDQELDRHPRHALGKARGAPVRPDREHRATQGPDSGRSSVAGSPRKHRERRLLTRGPRGQRRGPPRRGDRQRTFRCPAGLNFGHRPGTDPALRPSQQERRCSEPAEEREQSERQQEGNTPAIQGIPRIPTSSAMLSARILGILAIPIPPGCSVAA